MNNKRLAPEQISSELDYKISWWINNGRFNQVIYSQILKTKSERLEQQKQFSVLINEHVNFSIYKEKRKKLKFFIQRINNKLVKIKRILHENNN